jgi:hypothetical protein
MSRPCSRAMETATETETDATGVGSGARPLNAIKRIEDLFLLAPRNTGSPVLDRDNRPPGFGGQAYLGTVAIFDRAVEHRPRTRYLEDRESSSAHTMIELAWMWVRYQPDSVLSWWFRQRVGSERGRTRRISIVALARKLLIAPSRYVTHGEIPAGAVMKAV